MTVTFLFSRHLSLKQRVMDLTERKTGQESSGDECEWGGSRGDTNKEKEAEMHDGVYQWAAHLRPWHLPSSSPMQPPPPPPPPSSLHLLSYCSRLLLLPVRYSFSLFSLCPSLRYWFFHICHPRSLNFPPPQAHLPPRASSLFVQPIYVWCSLWINT